jgi:hypothetical protein
VDTDTALDGVSLRVNCPGGITEESTSESLEYSAIDITNFRRLIL